MNKDSSEEGKPGGVLSRVKAFAQHPEFSKGTWKRIEALLLRFGGDLEGLDRCEELLGEVAVCCDGFLGGKMQMEEGAVLNEYLNEILIHYEHGLAEVSTPSEYSGLPEGSVFFMNSVADLKKIKNAEASRVFNEQLYQMQCGVAVPRPESWPNDEVLLPSWIGCERSLFQRRFYFENFYGDQWVCYVMEGVVFLAGSRLKWVTIKYESKDYEKYIRHYIEPPKQAPDGYLITGLGKLTVEEARWMAGVLGIARRMVWPDIPDVTESEASDD